VGCRESFISRIEALALATPASDVAAVVDAAAKAAEARPSDELVRAAKEYVEAAAEYRAATGCQRAAEHQADSDALDTLCNELGRANLRAGRANAEVSGFAQCVIDGLGNPLLQRVGPVAETLVRHVVHRVVAPERRPGTDSDAFAKRRYAELTAERSRLRSYSLYVVRLGTAAFVNLVSQPIALTVPDMEAHVDASWQVKLPARGEPTATYMGVKDLTATRGCSRMRMNWKSTSESFALATMWSLESRTEARPDGPARRA